MPDFTSQLRILIAWEPHTSGPEAIEVAAWLSRSTPTTLRCVTTIARPWLAPAPSKKWLKSEKKRYLKSVTTVFENFGIPHRCWDETVAVLAEGSSESATLIQAAREFKADIVILGSKSVAQKRRFLPTSMAESMLHSSPIPLLLAPRAPKLAKRGVTRINFALVSESFDLAALHYAATIATTWSIPLRIIALSPEGFGESQAIELPDDLAHQWRENTLAELDRLSDEVHRGFPNVPVISEIGSGSGWEGALKSLKWKKGDFLCFGSAPLGAFERVFIGSQTSQILPFVKVPVLMVPARKE